MERTPEPDSRPVTVASETTTARKISWVALCIVLLLPLGFVVVGGSVMIVTLAEKILKPYFLSALLPSIENTIAGSVWLTVLLAGFLAWRGIKRGWNSAKGLRRGWGIAVVLLTTLMTSAYFYLRLARQSSANQVVLGQARQLSAAADQYFLENGVSTVSYNSLVGATNYVKAVSPTHQEIYPIYYTLGITITVTGVDGSRTVTYAP